MKLTVKLSYGSIDELLAKYGTNFSANGLFVRSKEARAVGTKVLLKVQLGTGQQVLQATGAVSDARPKGMKIEFDSVDAPGRALLERAWAVQATHLAKANQPLVIRLDESIDAEPPTVVPEPPPVVPESPPVVPESPTFETESPTVVPEPVLQGLIVPDDVGEAPSEEVFIPPEVQIDEEFDRLLASMPGPVREFEPTQPSEVQVEERAPTQERAPTEEAGAPPPVEFPGLVTLDAEPPEEGAPSGSLWRKLKKAVGARRDDD